MNYGDYHFGACINNNAPSEQQVLIKKLNDRFTCKLCCDFIKDVRVIAVNKCFHKFCKECIADNLKGPNISCPTCRRRFTLQELKHDPETEAAINEWKRLQELCQQALPKQESPPIPQTQITVPIEKKVVKPDTNIKNEITSLNQQLIDAAKSGDVKSLKECIESGVSLKPYRGTTVLHAAIASLNPDCVKLVLKHASYLAYEKDSNGENADDYITTLSCESMLPDQHSKLEQIEKLVKRMGVPDPYISFKLSPLDYDRITSGFKKFENNKDIMTNNEDVRTLLHLTASCQELMSKYHDCPCVIESYLSSLEMMIRNEINQKDANGKTAIARAAADGDYELLWALMKLGADFQLNEKETVLRIAILEFQLHCVKALLEHDPDLALVKDSDNRTAKELALAIMSESLFPGEHDAINQIWEMLK